MADVLNACSIYSSQPLYAVDAVIALNRCNECGFIFRNPRPSAAEISAYYSGETQYDAWLGNEKAREAMWERRLRKLLRYRACGALLDAGTGTGQFLHIARSHFNVEGTEVSASAVKIAKERYGLAVYHSTLEKAAAGALNVKRFDVITLVHVLEHVPDPARTLSACKKLLAEDGLLVIAVPNEIYRWNRPVRRILGLLRVGRFKDVGAFGLPRLDLSQPGGELHLSHFTCTVLKRLLEQQGFRVRELGLDPHYAALGFRAALHTMIYNLCSIVLRVTGVNIYDTIWVVAEKK